MTQEIKEIENFDDIKLLVDVFYGKIKEDKLLKDIFNMIIQDRWPQHMETMYSFWQTVLLGERTYNGASFIPHAHLPVVKEHFNRWLKLFDETVDAYFIGENATKAKWQANRMAEMFLHKIEYFRNNSNSIPLM